MQINDPAVVRELEALYPVYETALITNDVKTLTEMFWNSPLTTRFGITENLYGYDGGPIWHRSRPDNRGI
jgi:hypothetical protein